MEKSAQKKFIELIEKLPLTEEQKGQLILLLIQSISEIYLESERIVKEENQ